MSTKRKSAHGHHWTPFSANTASTSGKSIPNRLAVAGDGVEVGAFDNDAQGFGHDTIQHKPIDGGKPAVGGEGRKAVEAEDLALILRAGALPATMVYLEERTVGPSLGRDSVERGVKAAVVRDDDVITHALHTSAHAYLLFFTNRGKVYRIRAHQLPRKDRTAKGVLVQSVLPLEPGGPRRCASWETSGLHSWWRSLL